MKTLIKNCLLNGESLDLTLSNGRIERVAPNQNNADKIIDAAGKIILPGMIDLHTHIRDLEQSYKENWHSASLAAIAGGVTTVFDMPNSKPPTDRYENLLLKEQAASKSLINYGLYAGASADNIKEIEIMLESGKAAGVKVFLSASSSNEIITDEGLLLNIFRLAKKYNKPALVHCELQSLVSSSESAYIGSRYDNVRYHNLIRCREAAVEAVKLVLRTASQARNTVVLLHVSTKDEIDIIRQFRKSADFAVYTEVTPHHLLVNEEVLQYAGNYGKVNPPLRLKSDNDALMEAVIDGTISSIGSDHAPHSITEKQRNYFTAPSGFPGLETTLPLLISNSLQNGGLTIEKISELTALNPARIMNLNDRGRIAEGYIADLVLIDPMQTTVVKPERFLSRARYSPFAEMELRGRLVTTFVSGIEYNIEDLSNDYSGNT